MTMERNAAGNDDRAGGVVQRKRVDTRKSQQGRDIMLGLKKENDHYIFEAAVRTDQLFLNLYHKNRRVRQIAFDPAERIGDVWHLELPIERAEDGRVQSQATKCDAVELEAPADRKRAGAKHHAAVVPPLDELSYCYEADGHIFTDPNGTVFEGRKSFGNLRDGVRILKTPIGEATAIPESSEAWREDRALELPYEDSIIYRLHVRGFTEHSSSGLDHDTRGSFQGIIEKIPYLEALGVTTLELMPPYEFNEVMLPDYGHDHPYEVELRPTGRINYWGFTQDALQLAPKSSFTSDHKNPRNEFRKLVQTLHAHGMELVVDLYFTNETLPDYIVNVMRYWRIHYHVDGIHLIGAAPYGVIARDPWLSRFKIWADSWQGQIEEAPAHGSASATRPGRYLADYNDGFQNDMRRILKGDESMLPTLMQRVRENPSNRASIQYMANVSGMSLMDVLRYDRKHNEANHEENRDGTDQNYSWNCGEEGPTRKKSIKLLRKRMWRNAWLLLMLSQGTPLINAGDEFGQTHLGNNNPYCQDNALNWLDWRLLQQNQELYEFARFAIHFRKQHPVFHQGTPLRQMDYRSVGIPDISFHGENAWRPETENFRRQLGVLYAGAYAEDETFLVLYNLHWEKHTFLLAHPAQGMKWAMVIDTAREETNGIASREVPLPEDRYTVEPRSIVVLKAVKDPAFKPKTVHSRRKKRSSTGAAVSQAGIQAAGDEKTEADSRAAREKQSIHITHYAEGE